VDLETRQVLSDISEEEWRAYYRELVLFAHARCRRWLWRSGNKENLPEGHSPDSIVREAVTRLYDGTRVWNHEQYPGPSPVPFLKSVIDSLIWSLLSSAEHLHSAQLELDVTASDVDSLDQDFDRLMEGEGFSQSATLTPDEKIYFDEMEEQIRSAIADRQDLIELFDLLLEGLKPAEMAERMKSDVKRVYALRKTFDRRTADIQREIFGAAVNAKGAN
jgi:hypothetical protein